MTVGLAGVLLFVALIGAVAITNPKRPDRPVLSRLRTNLRFMPSHPTRMIRCLRLTCSLDVLRDYLLVGAVLFVLGMLGFLARRNLIVMFLSAEMMLQGTRSDAWSGSAATTATGPARSSRS